MSKPASKSSENPKHGFCRIPPHETERRRQWARQLQSPKRFGDPNAGFKICTKIKADGTPCRAIALNRSEYCYFHASNADKMASRSARTRKRMKNFTAPRRMTAKRFAAKLRDNRLKADQGAALEAVGRLWPERRTPPPEVEEAVAEQVGRAHYRAAYRCWKWLLCAAWVDLQAGRTELLDWQRAVHDHGPAALDWWRFGIMKAAKDDPNAVMRGETPLPPFLPVHPAHKRRAEEKRLLERRKQVETASAVPGLRHLDHTLTAAEQAALDAERAELAALGLDADVEPVDAEDAADVSAD